MITDYNDYREQIHLPEKYHFIHSEGIYLYVKESNAPCFIVSNIGSAKMPGPNLFFQQNGFINKEQISFPNKKIYKHTTKAFSKNT